MKRFLLIFLGVLALTIACNKDTTEEQVICNECAGLFSEKMVMYVDNELTRSPDNPNELCLRVQFNSYQGDTAWQPFCQDICGFDYEAGYMYVLDIQRKKITEDADGNPIYKYCLLRIKSKTPEPMK